MFYAMLVFNMKNAKILNKILKFNIFIFPYNVTGFALIFCFQFPYYLNLYEANFTEFILY